MQNAETAWLMLFFKKRVVFFGLLFLSLRAAGQYAEQFSFTHYGQADGLASNMVNNLVQDSTGFIWLSTNNGLQRFDGNKFITFHTRTGNPNGLPSDEVNSLYQDRRQRLWVQTADNRVGHFNTRTFAYTEVPIRRPSWERVYVEKNFIETAGGKLILHIRKTAQLFEYNEAENAFLPSSAFPIPARWTVNHVAEDRLAGKYYLASDSGLAVFNLKTGHLNYSHSNPDNESLVNAFVGERFIHYIFIDTKRRLFFEQWPEAERQPSLQVFNLKTGHREQHNFTKEYGIGYHQIRALLEQKNGKLWIYGLPFLAEYVHGPRPLQFLKKDYNKDKDLKFTQVFSMYEDRQQNIWICTDNGIYLFNPDSQFFHNYTLTTPKRLSVEGKAQSALQLPNGEIWIGYRDLGLHRYDRLVRPLPLPPALQPLNEKQSVWDLHQHSRTGQIWMTLQGGNLLIYDTLTRQSKQVSHPAFENRAITQVTEDRLGNLWFGTQAGNIVRWDFLRGGKAVADGFSLHMRTGIVEKLLTDSRGHIWIAAVGAGVMDIDPATGRIVRQLSRENKAGFHLWNNHPKDILQYNDSLLIVASGALNLVNIHNFKIEQISSANGLPTNTVQSLAKDAAGMLWLGTMNGLCVADLKKSSFTVYNQKDGLLNDQFTVAGGHALPDGRLLFMAAESFLLFHPDDIRRREQDSRVFITDFKVLNQSLPLDSLLALKQIILRHNKTYLSIEFSALNFNKLNKLDYYYQLEGLDTTWLKSNDGHQAVYTYLPPGQYTFRLKTRSVGGAWTSDVAHLRLLVLPPFYSRWWFFGLLAMVVSTVLYLIYRERIQRLMTLHNIRSDIASHLHKDVSTTLNSINVLSQIARMKADRDIDRSKELIDEISGKSYSMMVSMDEILWSIDPSNDTMAKTLLRLNEFAKTLETAYHTAIDLVVHEKVKNLQLDMKVRHDFFIVCKAALQQMAQYAGGSSIMVDIELARSKVMVKMLRTGIETENNPGLAELKKNLEEKASGMQANLHFEVGKRDVSVILSIPVKPNSVVPYTIFGPRK